MTIFPSFRDKLTLGSLYYWKSNRPNGDEHFSKALSHVERLTEKEKLYIEAKIERARGNYHSAVTKYKTFLRKYPDSESGWFGLGYSYMRLKNHREAIEAFHRSQEIFTHEDPNIYINIATCYHSMKNHSDALKYYIKAFEINPDLETQGNLNHEFGFNYVNMGEYAKAREVFNKMLNKNNDDMKAMGLRSLAMLNMYLGSFNNAIEMLNESRLLYTTLGYYLSIYRNTLYLASVYKTLGLEEKYNEELKTAKTIINDNIISPFWLLYYGKIIVRENRIEEAMNILEVLSSRINEGNRIDESAFQILNGEIELAKGNSDKAEKLFKTGVRMHTNPYHIESLANFYFQTGQLDLAIPEYKEIIHLKSLGWESQIYYNEAYFRLGKIYELKKDSIRAVKYYEGFLEIWQESQDDIPEIQHIMSSLKKLKGKTS